MNFNTRNLKDQEVKMEYKTINEKERSPRMFKVNKIIDLVPYECKHILLISLIASFMKNREQYKLKRKGEILRPHISTTTNVKTIDLQ